MRVIRLAWLGFALALAMPGSPATADTLAPSRAPGSSDAPATRVGISGASGSFTVAPTRVIIESPGRTAELTLINTGHDKAIYRLTLVDMCMSESGELAAADSASPAEYFADGLLRYSPHQVELEPGVPQTVRLLVQSAEPLKPGEYRSHLLVRAIPAAISPDSALSRDFSVALTPVYGVAIPILVRQGVTRAAAGIENLRLVTDGPPTRLAFDLLRQGNRSMYGNLSVALVRPGRKPIEIGAMHGVAVYVPNARRRVEIRLQIPPDQFLRDATLQVRYDDAESARGSLAEAELALQ